jgi:hypothetical protein
MDFGEFSKTHPALSPMKKSGHTEGVPRPGNKIHIPLKRVALTFLYAIAFAISLRAQAAVEYAAKSAGATLANTAAGIHFGFCTLDSAFVPCVHQHYPAIFYVGLVAICFLFGKLLFPKRRA